MATYAQTVRRGLPRQPGGDPWPAGGDAPVEAAEPDAAAGDPVMAGAPRDETPIPVAAVSADSVAASPHPVDESAGASSAPPEVAEPPAAVAASVVGVRTIRRGLPRAPGGEPWPPSASGTVPAVALDASPRPDAGELERGNAPVAAAAVVVGAAAAPGAAEAAGAAQAAPSAAAPDLPVADPTDLAAAPPESAASATDARPLRRGLPRVAGGEPWPRAGFAPAITVEPTHTVPSAPPARQVLSSQQPAPAAQTAPAAQPAPAAAAAQTAPAAQTALAASGNTAADVSTPLPFTRTVWAGAAARERAAHPTPVPKPETPRIGPFTRLQWAGAVIVGGAGLLFAAGMAVLAVRFLLSLEPFQDFLATYPGEYPLPEGAPVGIPPWLGWQHFFNVFLMVLIIRSGLQVRTEKRPTAFWSPRSNGKRKISLNLWFHQSLDILWIVNGVIFIALLFATGQWMKLVPTSWAVFPNALSAALQYVSLDWPTENGWVNYNSLQQLAYFATVFIAAPLAIATGVRMSGIWPKNATGLNKAYPVEWARAIHFPVMLYFVAFIIVHVALVLATGALRNLNHMYASQDVVNWVGFWIFLASLVVIAAGWIAARPLVLAPIARLFGRVSGR